MVRKKLNMIGNKVIRSAQSITIPLAQVAIHRDLFETILHKIDQLGLMPATG
jgi:hypothetical protein